MTSLDSCLDAVASYFYCCDDVFCCCRSAEKSPSPKLNRRHSLPSRYDTCLRLTRLKRFSSSEEKKIYRTSSQSIRSTKDFLKEIQHHRREGLKHAPNQQQLITPEFVQRKPEPRKLSKHEQRVTAEIHVFDSTLATAVNKLSESSKAERKLQRSNSQQRYSESSSNDELLSGNFLRLRPDKPETRVKKDRRERDSSRRREEEQVIWIQDPPYQGDPESLFVRRQNLRLPEIENQNIRRSKSVKDTGQHKKDCRSSARTFLDPSPVSEATVDRWIQPRDNSPVAEIAWYSGPPTPPRPYRTGSRKRVESPHRVHLDPQWILPCSSYDDEEGAIAAALPPPPPPLPRKSRSRKCTTHRSTSISPPTSYSTDPDFNDRMNALEEHERKIIIEFCHLLEKSKQLFNGLRELPQYGHKQWHSYFGRTFDVYTKLWKFQQQHRTILDNKYGLKRWQIGEIASKIGQLYYHFYLRTSETAYLNEAYSFYYAIRGRSYYTKASKEDKCELMVKKLRYYARFIVVCLLLKKLKLVSELIRELDKQIVEYGNAYDPEDQAEWTVVVNEVKAFIKAEPVVSVVHPDNYSVILSHRLSHQSTPPVDRLSHMVLTLQEVLIVGSNSAQVKFSELTMDMFRMMQTLEREPTGDIQHMFEESPRQQFVPASLNNTGYSIDCTLKYGDNPHKYLLFKPSPSQIFVYLASGCNDLPPNGVILLYVSADGLIVPPSRHPEEAAVGGFDVGGLITTSRSDITYRETIKDGKPVPPKHKEQQVLHPGDLFAFTRRPMFLIIDSDNSYIFQTMPRHFGQPLVILMSPVEIPTSLHMVSIEKRAEGSLFTLFLHSPLTALCFCCDIRSITLMQWERAQSYVDSFLAEASQILTRTRADSMYVAFMGDDFLRLLTLRFIFCETVMRLHRAFRSRNHLTRSSPPIPDDVFDHPALTHIVMELAMHLQIRGHFHEPAGAVGPAPNKE